jgi:hypothetical protein
MPSSAPGKLPEYIVQTFREHEVRELLEEGVSNDDPARVQRLRQRFADHARAHRKALFEALFKHRDQSADVIAARLRVDYPELSASVAEDIGSRADAVDRQVVLDRQRLPLRLHDHARAAALEVRLNRAYEGLFLDELANPDTDRLALHTVETLAGWSPQVRLEVRNFSFTGPLHDSLGPVDAPIRKILINQDGLYEARDSHDQHLHGENTLYAAILHALPDAEREALGFEINQGELLRNSVARSPLSHDRFRSILRENPLRRPAFDREHMRLRGGMPGYRRANLDELFDGSPEEVVERIYPGLTSEEGRSFLASLDTSGQSLISQLMARQMAYEELSATLQDWVSGPTESWRISSAGRQETLERDTIAKALKRCWKRTGPKDFDADGNYLGQKLELQNVPLQRHLRSMPALPIGFDDVTGLNLHRTGITSEEELFLQYFPNLRSLDMTANQLTRFPDLVPEMRHLRSLHLSNNLIVLTDDSVAQLRGMKRLRTLDLEANPLGRSPDISQMPELHTLLLRATEQQTWPTGLFGKPRFRHFHLDLQHNLISRIPEVAPGSVRAELLARTLISRDPEWMSVDNMRTFRQYIESVGLDPDRSYPPRGVRDSLDWEQGMTRREWVQRQALWNVIEDEIGSEGFFNEIRKLTRSNAFTDQEAPLFRLDLTAKLWRMLEAMYENSELREKLFTMATAPTECVDGGVQLFNAMGLEVLVHEAYGLVNKGLVEAELVSLAKGKSRLNALGAIARARVAERLAAGERFRVVDPYGNVTGTIDEVEVHLAYMTDLAERLDLPWQSRKMQFRAMAKVTPDHIEAAYNRVLALEENDLLRDSIVEQAFWNHYVRGANRRAFNGLRRQGHAFIELQDAQEQWANDTSVTAVDKALLRQRIESLATKLGKPLSEVSAGQVMTDEALQTELDGVDDRSKQLLKTLTRQAMDRAKLQRDEIPFTVSNAD